jgi:hypothetical protein
MVDMVKEWPAESSPSADPKVFAIVVIPWLNSVVPLFSIVTGLFLEKRGNKVVFILDDLRCGKNSVRFTAILGCLTKILQSISPRRSILKLSDYIVPGELSSEDEQRMARYAQWSGVWTFRGEKYAKGRDPYVEQLTRQFSTSYLAIKALIEKHKFDVFFLSGGIFISSGIWFELAKAAGARVATHDGGGPGILALAVDGIAAQLQDIPRAFYMLKSRPDFEKEKQIVLDMAQAEMKRRRAGSDKFASQMVSKSQRELTVESGVLIALNSSWDTAALGLNCAFENNTKWIIETTRWLLNNTSANVIIRQHPAERLEIARTNDDYAKLLFENFGENPRLHFVAAGDPVNTYDLLDVVTTVITHVSTIGIEAASFGKIVITPTAGYYSSLGFVWYADNQSTYFMHIDNALKGLYDVGTDMIQDALCCYYVTQCCNWLFTPFNQDFDDWRNYSLDDLYNLDSTQLIITSIDTNIPVAILNHQANLSSDHMMA